MKDMFKAFVAYVIKRVKDEPVLVTQAAAAILSALTVLGFGLPAATAAAIMGLAQVVAAFISRSKVTPTAKIEGASGA